MNRKQAGIILTLLALIICTGILASRVNSELKSGMDELITGADKNEDSTTATSEEYFYEARSLRAQQDDQYIDGLNAIIADENTSKEKKEDATETLSEKNMAMEFEARIEMNIKSKGFEDAVCYINDDEARVIVK
ncbi:MAG: SpoIIIAH-like family protein, partial [Sarcina sp.]